MACTTCSRSGTASPSSDKTLTITGRVTMTVPNNTFAASVGVRLVDFDDMPDLTKAVLCDAAEARIITRQTQSKRITVKFDVAAIAYGAHDPTACLVYQGKSIVDPNGWTPVPPTYFVRDASNRVIGANILLDDGALVVVTAP